MSERVHAPSELGVAEQARFRVGGRVVDVASDGFALGDAFATAWIAAIGPEVEPGDLVVADVERAGDEGRLALVALAARHRPARRIERGEHARLAQDGVGANLVARARAAELVRAYFGSEGFLEVETPAIVPCPGLDPHLDAVAADDRWIATSPEYQMKRLLAGGVPRCFQLAHVARRGEVGARHDPAFTMLEWYRAFAEVDEVILDTEQLVAAAVAELSGDDTVGGPAGPVRVAPPFERIAVDEAFVRWAGTAPGEALALAGADEDRYFRLLVEDVEPALARLDHPVFLVDYPIAQASLARARPDDPRVCERFELYVGGVELCNGFGELTDPVEQRARLLRDQAARRAAGKPVYPLDERFLAALEEGMPPSAGNALGFDRLVAVALGEPAIERVMSFPASWL